MRCPEKFTLLTVHLRWVNQIWLHIFVLEYFGIIPFKLFTGITVVNTANELPDFHLLKFGFQMEDNVKINYTEVIKFIIVGFPGNKKIQILYFIIFLVIYLLTLLGNIILLFTLKAETSLHTPMYFFLSNLAVLEIGYTSVTLPKLLAVSIGTARHISLTACLTQSYFFFFLGSTECFFLAVMAFDRYLAICNPLRYPILMYNRVCVSLAIGSWFTGFLNPCPSTIMVGRLHFCSNVINHFFCDVPPLLSLSCSNIYISRTSSSSAPLL